jgi:hypothetical protein
VNCLFDSPNPALGDILIHPCNESTTAGAEQLWDFHVQLYRHKIPWAKNQIDSGVYELVAPSGGESFSHCVALNIDNAIFESHSALNPDYSFSTDQLLVNAQHTHSTNVQSKKDRFFKKLLVIDVFGYRSYMNRYLLYRGSAVY